MLNFKPKSAQKYCKCMTQKYINQDYSLRIRNPWHEEYPGVPRHRSIKTKIRQKTSGKQCSCPSVKICSSCKLKKVIHPRVKVEEPRRVPVPVSVTYYDPPKAVYQNSPTVQYVEKSKRWKMRKKRKRETSPPQCLNVCRWYKRRKAFKELVEEKKKEDERERKRKREEFERERLRDFVDWENAKQRTQSLPPPKKKIIYIKERSASAKPRAQSRYATVKKLDREDSITHRFVNCCYRLCCTLYCCLTCALLAALAAVCFV